MHRSDCIVKELVVNVRRFLARQSTCWRGQTVHVEWQSIDFGVVSGVLLLVAAHFSFTMVTRLERTTLCLTSLVVFMTLD